jgi:hypothetical protein
MGWDTIKKQERVVGAAPKKSTGMYNVTRVEFDGHKFDSMGERDRYIVLKKMMQDGEISDLVHHRVYTLLDGGSYRGEKIRPIEYEADFVYQEQGETVVEDVKSTKTALDAQYKIKVKMFKLRYPELLFREYIAVER